MFLSWYYLYLYFNFCTYQDCERMYGCQPVSACVCVFECVDEQVYAQVCDMHVSVCFHHVRITGISRKTTSVW